MEQVTVTMHKADLSAFATVSKHPFVVTPANEPQTQAPAPKTKRKMWPTRPTTLKAYRQRITAFVAEHSGTTGNQIIKNVSGSRSNIGAQIKAMRESGELRVVGNGWADDPYRYYPATEGQVAA